MAECQCQKLNEVERVYENASFFTSLEEVEQGDWVYLRRCAQCGQLWAVDEWDKGQVQFATKIPADAKSNWQVPNVEAQKRFLAKSRGGFSASEICAWARCGKPCVVGSAYCIDHLYQTGARE